MSFIKKVGCIQFDPIDVVGRNPDLVLQSRCPHYKRGEIEKLLYEDRKLFDVYDKCMAICHIDDFPYFSRIRGENKEELKRFSGEIEAITAYLKEYEYAGSGDFHEMNEKIDWYWAPQKKIRAVLDIMNYCGLVTVHHRNKGRRFFSLTERYFSEELVGGADPNQTLEDYHKWAIKRRINSVGMLTNSRSDAFLGIVGLKSKERQEAFAILQKGGEIQKVEIEGCKAPFFIATENIPLLKEFIKKEIPTENTRILAPLDHLMWDRKLVEEIFEFYYRWEVYVPQEKRQYGYYVLPVLCGSEMVARIEMKTDRNTETLVVHNIWFEEKERASVLKKQIKACLQQFKRYNSCKRIQYKTSKLK